MNLDLENKEILFNVIHVTDVLDVIKNYPMDYKLYNSYFDLEYTKNCELEFFDPIYGINSSDHSIKFCINNTKEPINNKEFIENLYLIENDLGGISKMSNGNLTNCQNIIIREDLNAIIIC